MRLAVRVALLLVLVVGLLVVGATALDRPATSVHEEMVVEAPRRVVWRLLTDFAGYDAWNPYITRASGRARHGSELDLRLEPLGEEPQEVTCDVITVRAARKLYWRCRDHNMPGLLDREHTFRLLPMGADRVRLVYDGRWEGILVPFVDLDDRQRGYRRMALALKARAEGSSKKGLR